MGITPRLDAREKVNCDESSEGGRRRCAKGLEEEEKKILRKKRRRKTEFKGKIELSGFAVLNVIG